MKISPDTAQGLLCGSYESVPSKNEKSKVDKGHNDSFCGAAPRPPLYPPDAKKQNIEGVVTLKVVIGVDGTIKNLSVIDGHVLLVPSAVDAVRRWKYKPYYVDGKPTEVETNITVNFKLAK